MPIIQSQAPYYDDFDETKDFYQILFRPGFGVQARELTQLQTILQNQVQRFGDHVFKDGSQVTGGGNFVDLTTSVKLVTGSNSVPLTQFANSIAISSNTGIYFRVKAVVPATGSDPDTIIGSPVTGYRVDDTLRDANSSVIVGRQLANNETLTFYTSNGTSLLGTANTAAISNVNFQSTLVHQNEGVYYVDGYFTRVLANTSVAGKYTSNVNVIYGFTRSDSLVTSDDDSTLLDNATGASNFTAPGAHRLSIKLNPSIISLDSYSELANNVTDTNFFEQLRIKDGNLYKERGRPDYNNLEEVLAQRTYEESGNYAINNFNLSQIITSANTSNTFIRVSSGTAYVKGKRLELFDSTDVVLNKARDTDRIEDYDISSYYGNYLKVNFLANGMFDIDSAQKVELHNCANTVDAVANSSGGSDTKIGTAHVRQIDYESGTGAANNTIYKLFLFKTEMDGANTIHDVKTIIAGNSFSNTTTAAANVVSATGEYSNGSTRLFEPNYNRLVFPIPYGQIQSVPEHKYTLRRVFENITFTNGVATISTASAAEDFVGASGGDVPASLIRDYYQVIIKTASGTYTKGEFVHMDTGSKSINLPAVGGGSVGLATVDLDDATFNGTADIIATIEITNPSFKTKTLVANATVSFATGTVSSNTYSLGKSDGYRVRAIYMSPNTSVVANDTHTNVTERYSFNNGQRDNFYDHAYIRHLPSAANTTGQINVVFDYFSHTGLGAFVVNSYPISYPLINGFTSERTGEKLKLRNVIDFRPRRTDDSTNNDVTFDNSQIPHAFDSVESTFDFFLSRTDKIFLTDSGELKIKKGVPSFDNPVAPEDIPNAMRLGSIKLGPYTFGSNDVSIFPTDNSRYTMKDIGKLEQRLSRVEFYTSLSLLEKEIQQLQILDENSNELFKNGILVDSFAGFGVADVLAPDFDASIDIEEKYARPPYAANSIGFSTGTLTNLRKTGDLITMDYTEELFGSNDLASNTEFVNPFSVFQFIGNLTLSPDSDVWYEQNTLPIVGINTEGQFDNYETIGTDSAWNNWISNWSGYDRVDFETVARGSQSIQRETTDVRTSSTREGIIATTAPNQVYALIDQKVINKTVIPFMRSIDIKYTAEGLQPNTQFWCYFDGRQIPLLVTPNGGSKGDKIISNENGFANGIISIPNASNTYAFLTGDKRVVLADSFQNPKFARTLAQGTFSALGYIETVQGEIISAKYKNIVRTQSSSGSSSSSSGYNNNSGDPDPPTTYNVLAFDFIGKNEYGGNIIQSGGRVTVTEEPDFVDGGTIEDLAAEVGLSVADTQTYVNTLDSIYTSETSRNIAKGATDSTTAVDFGGAAFWINEAVKAGTAPGESNANIETAIRTGLKADAGKAVAVAFDAGVIDPVSQTFFVNQDFFPNGAFLSSIDLYFAAKDDNNIPVSVELRPTVNGYPSSTVIIPLSTVYKNPDEVATSSDGTSATKFTFPSPVYVESGKEYAIVVRANSDKYATFISRMGETDFTSGNKISSQPTVGVFFKSSNSSTWSPDQSADLKFRLKCCKFETGTGTVEFNNESYGTAQDYHTIHVKSHEMVFAQGQNIEYSAETRTKATSALASYNIQQNKNFYFETEQTVASGSSSEITLTGTITNDSEYTSPVIDATRTSSFLIKNIVNNTTDVTTPETLAISGDAKARYISRRVTLAEGFDATRLTTYLKVNRQPGTSIEVYYKALSAEDNADFDDRPYIQMTRIDDGGDIFTASRFGFREDEFVANTVAYTSETGSFDSIKTFAVKVVFYSSNPAIVPKIKDLRVVALS